jgi:hypothetical protein
VLRDAGSHGPVRAGTRPDGGERRVAACDRVLEPVDVGEVGHDRDVRAVGIELPPRWVR